MRKGLRKNKYLVAINRLRKGYTPVYIEYGVNFISRWKTEEGNPFLSKIISSKTNQYKSILKELSIFTSTIETIANQGNPIEIDFHNHFIPVLDGVSIMWAASKSKQVFLEIGSGTSTKFAKAGLLSSKSKAKLISIDPEPRTEIDSLCDEVHRSPLEEMDLSIFDQLAEGDTVFFDGSHRSFMNSDVTTFMLDVMPRLKSGVLVGIHDIYLPFDYYSHWSERGYNEQYLLACYLLSDENYFDIKLSNHWISKKKLHHEHLGEIYGILGVRVRDRLASAFWGVKR